MTRRRCGCRDARHADRQRHQQQGAVTESHHLDKDWWAARLGIDGAKIADARADPARLDRQPDRARDDALRSQHIQACYRREIGTQVDAR
ncbi:MAG TPA: hypothetical protein VKB76_11900, partial [Ktedonobacterales bacterium]|nr:hypothetical protein [Ktedonobacterales bacterium]